jgi:hypothetical protein
MFEFVSSASANGPMMFLWNYTGDYLKEVKKELLPNNL